MRRYLVESANYDPVVIEASGDPEAALQFVRDHQIIDGKTEVYVTALPGAHRVFYGCGTIYVNENKTLEVRT